MVKTKRVAGDAEGKQLVAIALVAGLAIGVVQPQAIVIAFNVPEARIAIGIRNV